MTEIIEPPTRKSKRTNVPSTRPRKARAAVTTNAGTAKSGVRAKGDMKAGLTAAADRSKPQAKAGRRAASPSPPPDPPPPSSERRTIPWVEIRSAYEGSLVPVATIARAYGVRERLIYNRVAKDSWTPRRLQATEPGIAGAGYDRAVLVARLFQAVERQLTEIECRFMGPDGIGADEKDARTLSALARTLELLIGLERQAKPEPTDAAEADIDAFRRDLARRIASLQAAEGD